MDKQESSDGLIKSPSDWVQDRHPASDIQLCLLQTLGVGHREDLSREEAQKLIDDILRQKGRKVDGRLLPTE